MPAQHKPVPSKRPAASKKSASRAKNGRDTKVQKSTRPEPQAAKGSNDLAAQVRRLTSDVEDLKVELRKRPGGQEGSTRRDQDKILADRLARLDEKIESLWGRVADMEEHFEGEGGARTRDREPEFDEPPDRDFYER
jgi:TolA-binding protein